MKELVLVSFLILFATFSKAQSNDNPELKAANCQLTILDTNELIIDDGAAALELMTSPSGELLVTTWAVDQYDKPMTKEFWQAKVYGKNKYILDIKIDGTTAEFVQIIQPGGSVKLQLKAGIFKKEAGSNQYVATGTVTIYHPKEGSWSESVTIFASEKCF